MYILQKDICWEAKILYYTKTCSFNCFLKIPSNIVVEIIVFATAPDGHSELCVAGPAPDDPVLWKAVPAPLPGREAPEGVPALARRGQRHKQHSKQQRQCVTSLDSPLFKVQGWLVEGLE